MKVDTSQTNFVNQYISEQVKSKSQVTNDSPKTTGNDIPDTFQSNSVKTDATYSNPKLAMNSAVVEKLMGESNDILGTVQSLVTDLLKRQGYTVDQLKGGQVKEIKVDQTAIDEANKLIGPGGDLSPEKVSDRIVDFSIAAFGGDKSKIDIIRNAIDRGFGEAQKMLGGQLSDVSKKTYEMIQDKLNKWVNEDKTSQDNTGTQNQAEVTA